MVAYNFMIRLAPDVETGRKPFTIRDERKGRSRHARPGEDIQLYTGMRTTACRKLVNPDPICERVVPIIMWRVNQHRCSITLDGKLLTHDQADYIVTVDGFKSHEEFMEYHLGDSKTVKKIFIQWGFWNVD